MPERRPCRLLVVEDNPDCLLLFQRAAPEAGFTDSIHFVADEQTAIHYLQTLSTPDRPQPPVPQLIVQNLRPAHTDGLPLLTWLRQHSTLHRLPVVVLIPSKNQQDIDRAYASGANSCLPKPDNAEAVAELLRLLHAYWTGWNLAMDH